MVSGGAVCWRTVFEFIPMFVVRAVCGLLPEKHFMGSLSSKVEAKPCVHLFNRASRCKVSSYFCFSVRHFRSSFFRRDCFRRTYALFQIFVAVEFHRGMRHFHLSLCSFVDTLRT